MKPNPPKFPHIGSHEFAGTVVALSDGPSDIAKVYPPGTRLGVPGRGYNVCGSCFECKDPSSDYVGYGYRCPNGLSNGLSKDGGFSEYVVVDARQVAVLPDNMSAVTAAPLMCAGVTIYNALKKCNLSPGQRVAIVGAGGGLGNLGLQFAEAMELLVVGVDAADGPLEIAKSLGTKASIIDARSTPADEVVQKIGEEDRISDRPNMGVDAAIILPESQAGFDYGVNLLRNHGVCVVVSFPENGFNVSARDLVFRDISVIGTMLGSRNTLQEMVAFAAKHDIKAVTKTYSLGKLNDLVDEYNKGEGGKLVVDMSL
jgi:D-arabinose 1-dehydrogenase-like Zn-dependent alcohol dehydrogenase